jgi:hypothetical protein
MQLSDEEDVLDLVSSDSEAEDIDLEPADDVAAAAEALLWTASEGCWWCQHPQLLLSIVRAQDPSRPSPEAIQAVPEKFWHHACLQLDQCERCLTEVKKSHDKVVLLQSIITCCSLELLLLLLLLLCSIKLSGAH